MPLVPERLLDEARKELEEVRRELEEELAIYRSEAGRAESRVEELEGERSRHNPVLELLLELEREVRKADHVLTVDRYDPGRLRWILDRLDVVRVPTEGPGVRSDQGSMERMREASNGPV